jgi:ketosteroid isomerase-like protein
VALSGELGYTYGIYEVRSRGGIKTIGEGTYVTIWKKDRQGNWKFVLDAGNEGLGPKK